MFSPVQHIFDSVVHQTVSRFHLSSMPTMNTPGNALDGKDCLWLSLGWLHFAYVSWPKVHLRFLDVLIFISLHDSFHLLQQWKMLLIESLLI